MPEILARGVGKNLRQRKEKIQKENMTILPLIEAALETAVLELAASKVAPIARLLRGNGFDIATGWQSKNYGFVWWVTAANLQFQTIKDAIRDINCFGISCIGILNKPSSIHLYTSIFHIYHYIPFPKCVTSVSINLIGQQFVCKYFSHLIVLMERIAKDIKGFLKMILCGESITKSEPVKFYIFIPFCE
ncbi:hypothetical protein LOD99_15143 [Oopsacas minuta]|uniref:Uncharacterized protein n=1 Tax=Oopsacas minuta TaxID=111878 RepID=A0AAV7KC79_9METZ|nr:hypothetical protein LOD99_15143 [Oopsacas minuta]